MAKGMAMGIAKGCISQMRGCMLLALEYRRSHFTAAEFVKTWDALGRLG